MTAASKLLGEWRELADAATEGPWAIWHDLDHSGFKTVGDAESYEEVLRDGFTEDSNPTAHVYTDEDAEFIAASRTAVPALLSAVEKVFALEDWPVRPSTMQGYEIDEAQGYNQALKEVRAALNEALETNE